MTTMKRIDTSMMMSLIVNTTFVTQTQLGSTSSTPHERISTSFTKIQIR